MGFWGRLLGRTEQPPPDPVARPGRLILGLGNPGPDYEDTRHNAGFLVVDRVAEKAKLAVREEFGASLVGEGSWRGRAFAAAKPLTWMNRSGQAYAALKRRYALSPDNVLVVYDDIALPIGQIRIRPGGSAGGHNGVQDIAHRLGHEAFPRLRVGIGSDFPRGAQARYVLEPFTDEQLAALEPALEAAAEACLTFVRDGLEAAMNRHNKRGG